RRVLRKLETGLCAPASHEQDATIDCMAIAAMTDGQNKTLHPFFVKPQVPASKPTPNAATHSLNDDASPGADDNSSQSELPTIPDASNGRKTRPRKAKQKPDATSTSESIESTTSTGRKRRKLSLTDHVVVPDRGSEDMLPQPSSPTSVPSSHPENSQPVEQHQDIEPQPEPTPAPQNIPPSTPPKKMLKLSTGGTLVSPPSKPLSAKENAQTKKPARRGRPKKEKQKLLVTLRYPPNHALGHQITRILDGSETFRISKPPPMAPPPKPKAPKPDPSKPTHPFFSGKPKEFNCASGSSLKGQTDPKVSHVLSPRRPSAVTPGKLRAQARENGLKNMDNSSSFPQFGANKDRNIIKQPGMVEAPFPPKGHAHVRGDFYYHTSRPQGDAFTVIPRSTRKMKYKIPLLDPSESLMVSMTLHLRYVFRLAILFLVHLLRNGSATEFMLNRQRTNSNLCRGLIAILSIRRVKASTLDYQKYSHHLIMDGQRYKPGLRSIHPNVRAKSCN
ncbi:P-loop containing nucleoside triphosphate hydrolase protein, partial [Aureobasidium melanogenum]